MITKDFIMESFWQHPQGTNCATIAIIKVAILHFGIGKVFLNDQKRKGSYTIQLRNGKSIKLNDTNIQNLNRGNMIVFSYYKILSKRMSLFKLRNYVRLCYAVMVEYLNKYGIQNQKFSLKDSRQFLEEGFGENDPFNTDHLYKCLGLRMATKEVMVLKKNICRI